jgi:hypothetical protein
MARRTKATKPKKPADGGIKRAVAKLGAVMPIGAKAATLPPVKTAASRLAGVRPSGPRSFLTAAAAAGVAGVALYRLLRSGD